MLLDNYYKFQRALFLYETTTLKTVSGGTTSITAGNAQKGLKLSESMMRLYNGYNASGGNIVVGDGDTPPTVNDYVLSGNVISGLEASSTKSVNELVDGGELIALVTITNNNAESVTIKEIGLAANGSPGVLLERTVLESPITIEPGGVGQITYTIRMNYPTA